MFQFSQSSLDNRSGVDDRLIQISDRALQLTKVDFGHGQYAGKRTADEQNMLYTQGKSELDGYNKKSYHQTGKALDFYAYVDGKASWYEPHLAMVACAFLQAANELGYKISWGGLWSNKNSRPVHSIKYGWDCPHIQLEE